MTREPWQITQEMFLSEEEVSRLLRHVRTQARAAPDDPALDTDRLIIELLLFSGVRPSEFCRLTQADVIATETESYIRVTEGRGTSRTVYIPRWLSRELTRNSKHHALLRSTRKSSAPLIPNERGRPYERTSLYRRVIRILTAAGLEERASVQLLRHTYGYLAYKRTGGNLLFVQRQLGHAHPMVTAIYAQFVDENPTSLADTIAATDQPSSAPKEHP